jgi:hypothetical protein
LISGKDQPCKAAKLTQPQKIVGNLQNPKFLSKDDRHKGTMARKRRKDGHRNGEEAITATKGVPTDTNVEVLPVRETEVEKTKSTQV